MAWASVCCTNWVPQGRKNQSSIVKCRLSWLHGLLCVPQQGPWKEKNHQFWAREQEVCLFWKSTLPTSSYWSWRNRESPGIRKTHKSCQSNREAGKNSGGHPCEKSLPYPDLAGAQVSWAGKRTKAGQGHTEITGWSWEPLSTQTKHTTEDLATTL